MTDLTGSCMCGAISFTASGDPRFAMICQCRSCQRNTGSGNAAQVAVEASGFSFSGTPAEFTRTAASGNAVTKSFCPSCGCPLWAISPRLEGGVMIMAGALDDPALINPNFLAYSEEAQHWDHAALPEPDKNSPKGDMT